MRYHIFISSKQQIICILSFRKLQLCDEDNYAIIHTLFILFHSYLIRPYLACDTTTINTSTTILGHHVSMPLCIAPTERQHFIHPQAEHITATGEFLN